MVAIRGTIAHGSQRKEETPETRKAERSETAPAPGSAPSPKLPCTQSMVAQGQALGRGTEEEDTGPRSPQRAHGGEGEAIKQTHHSSVIC